MPAVAYKEQTCVRLTQRGAHRGRDCPLPRSQVSRYRFRLEALAHGDLAAAMECSTAKAGGSKELETLDTGDDDSATASKKAAIGDPKRIKRNGVITTHCAEAMRGTIGDFFRCQPPSKCANCKCANPAIKKQGAMKLFQARSWNTRLLLRWYHAVAMDVHRWLTLWHCRRWCGIAGAGASVCIATYLTASPRRYQLPACVQLKTHA